MKDRLVVSTQFHPSRWVCLIALMIGISASCAIRLSAEESPKLEFDGDRAYQHLVDICKIGARISGSPGMTRQQKMIVDHFEKLGATVTYQSFDVAHPLTGNPVRMNNLIVSWDPKAEQRILLCCHYDTRPFPDRDRFNPRGIFYGANDGASGVALFMEMGESIKKLKIPYGYGVDMVFFDGEELVYRQGDDYFLGSKYFSSDYKNNPPKHKYVYGVLVDMIAGRNLKLYYEINSLKHAPEVTKSVWAAAEELKEKAFISKPKHEVLDDHLPLNEIAKIPTCDLIDFDYPHWHTQGDVPRNCSGASLERVGRVLLYWLQNPLKVE
ncbi:MAG TPA: M28 family peptidase [Planctomycetaceae bacterium]|nr:M28 family peptidase [Planctomycetaceae bacterium]